MLLPILAAAAVGRPMPAAQAFDVLDAVLDRLSHQDPASGVRPGPDAALLGALSALPARMLVSPLADGASSRSRTRWAPRPACSACWPGSPPR